MASKELISAVDQYDKFVKENGITEKAINAYCLATQTALIGEKDIKYGLALAARVKEIIRKFIKARTGGTFERLELYAFENNQQYELINQYYDILLYESYYHFESFCFIMERWRHPNKRFYQPRRKTLQVVAQDLQDLEDGKLKFLGVSLPSRTGKSTLCIFFLSWIALRHPNSHNAMGGHSGILAKGFYKELLNLMSSEEYTFKELFGYWHPDHTVIRDKSADDFTITLDEPDRFATITCRGIDGTWTGAIDISPDGYLYVDDLVRDRQHSLSPIRMEDTWQEYLNKMVDRKQDGAKELMVGTLWNVLDPLERMRNKYEGQPGYRFRQIPALNDNDESNFDYEINGFSTEYYRNMRERLDNAEWMAKYQQKPYVREGLLFGQDELRYFNGVLPEGDHRIVAVVDVAWGGGDSLSMPIGVEYENGDVYIVDWVFNAGAKEETVPLVVGQIIKNEIRQCRFEGNVGGAMYSKYVDEKLKEHGWKCALDEKKAPNKMSKMEKIVAYSGDIKNKFVFLTAQVPTWEEIEKDRELGITRYMRSKEYQKAMDELNSFVTIGKNEHDDAADGLTQLSMFIENPSGSKTAMIIKSPI